MGGFQCSSAAFYLRAIVAPCGHRRGFPENQSVSRLMLDNFAHIKAYWVMLGKRLAQVALHYGANDLDGTIADGGELSESYSVESNNKVKMSKHEIIALIEDAGFEAVERDTVYNRVERDDSAALMELSARI